MKTIYTLVDAPGHVWEGHEERPERLALVQWPAFAARIEARPALAEEIARVHTPALIAALERACQQQAPAIVDYAPTFITPTSYEDALLAAGGLLTVTRAVLDGSATNGFAVVRPPGHHAEPDAPMGFCIFNNVAVAARDALARGLDRVLIVDFDAHHGNGTQAAFLREERVAYISTHQENIYPGSGRLIEEFAHARGRIANLPMPERAGDGCLAALTEGVIAPLARAFRPQLMLVSAGFDPHWQDPLTELGMTTAGFYAISHALVELAGELCAGKIVFALEGGYHPLRVAQGIAAVFAALAGKDRPAVDDPSPYREPDIRARVEAARRWHNLK